MCPVASEFDQEARLDALERWPATACRKNRRVADGTDTATAVIICERTNAREENKTSLFRGFIGGGGGGPLGLGHGREQQAMPDMGPRLDDDIGDECLAIFTACNPRLSL